MMQVVSRTSKLREQCRATPRVHPQRNWRWPRLENPQEYRSIHDQYLVNNFSTYNSLYHKGGAGDYALDVGIDFRIWLDELSLRQWWAILDAFRNCRLTSWAALKTTLVAPCCPSLRPFYRVSAVGDEVTSTDRAYPNIGEPSMEVQD